jgi:hypothetical protein
VLEEKSSSREFVVNVEVLCKVFWKQPTLRERIQGIVALPAWERTLNPNIADEAAISARAWSARPFCTSWSERNWNERSLEWHEAGSRHRSRLVSVPISPLDQVEESSHEVPTTFLVDT